MADATNFSTTLGNVGSGIGGFLNPLIGGTQNVQQVNTTMPDDNSNNTTALVIVAFVIIAAGLVYYLSGGKSNDKTE